MTMNKTCHTPQGFIHPGGIVAFFRKNLLVAVAGKNIAEGRTDDIKILRKVINIK